MKTLSFGFGLRGHTYIAKGISNRDQLAEAVAVWAENPELDFAATDCMSAVDHVLDDPRAHKLIASWPRCS